MKIIDERLFIVLLLVLSLVPQTASAYSGRGVGILMWTLLPFALGALTNIIHYQLFNRKGTKIFTFIISILVLLIIMILAGGSVGLSIFELIIMYPDVVLLIVGGFIIGYFLRNATRGANQKPTQE